MQELSITEIAKKHTVLKDALEKGPVRIIWKEQKPNGKQVFSAIAKGERIMDFEIIGKDAVFELDVVSKQTGLKTYYFGAGWDNPAGPVDLDIVCAALVNGKLTEQKNFVYFGNRFAPGISLSEDNTTGEGDGDDESIVIDTDKLAPAIDSIVIGLVAYAGADLSSATNPHFRVCDGSEESSVQIADVDLKGSAKSGDTVLVAFTLIKGANGWEMKNNAEYHSKGSGKAAITGFGNLFS